MDHRMECGLDTVKVQAGNPRCTEQQETGVS